MSLASPAVRATARFANPLAHIPGEDGWPIVGKTFTLLRDPVAESWAMYNKYGPVFRGRAFGYRNVSLLGPEANEFVLFDRERNFSSQHGWDPLLGRVFPRGLMMLDFDEHRLHRKALGVAFKTGPMKSYLLALNQGIATRIAEWHLEGDGQGEGARFPFYPRIKQLTLDLAATSFLGVALGPEAAAVNRAFVDMVAAAVTPIRQPIPGTQMWRGVNGRKVISEYFGAEIPKRRNGTGEDLFSELCRATMEDGRLLTEQEIIDHMSFLMMAAHDTLTSSVTSLVSLLCANPEWQDKLRAEALSLGLPKGAALPYDKLPRLELTEMAFMEAMRINPPVPGIPRRAVREVTFMGHRIPEGTGVNINPLFTHNMPDIWPEPHRFDPLRFTDDAIKTRHKFAWVPFSGGAHMCLGLHFAYMQAKTFFYHLLTTSRITTTPEANPNWQMWPIPKPRDGLPIVLERV